MSRKAGVVEGIRLLGSFLFSSIVGGGGKSCRRRGKVSFRVDSDSNEILMQLSRLGWSKGKLKSKSRLSRLKLQFNCNQSDHNNPRACSTVQLKLLTCSRNAAGTLNYLKSHFALANPSSSTLRLRVEHSLGERRMRTVTSENNENDFHFVWLTQMNFPTPRVGSPQ